MDLIIKRKADDGNDRWSVGISQGSVEQVVPSGSGPTKAEAIADFLDEVNSAIEVLQEAAKAARDM